MAVFHPVVAVALRDAGLKCVDVDLQCRHTQPLENAAHTRFRLRHQVLVAHKVEPLLDGFRQVGNGMQGDQWRTDGLVLGKQYIRPAEAVEVAKVIDEVKQDRFLVLSN